LAANRRECKLKKVLLPVANAADLAHVPPELFSKFQTTFFSDPIDAVLKAFAG
jgi:ATP-dependent Lon protease